MDWHVRIELSTYLTDRRNLALIVGYQAAKDTPEISDDIAGIPFDVMVNNLSDWEVRAVERNGNVIGMMAIKDGEVHFCISKEFQGRWLTRSLLKEISKMDIRFTTVNINNKPKMDFVEKIGFKSIGMVGDTVIYQLEVLKHGH